MSVGAPYSGATPRTSVGALYSGAGHGAEHLEAHLKALAVRRVALEADRRGHEERAHVTVEDDHQQHDDLGAGLRLARLRGFPIYASNAVWSLQLVPRTTTKF